MTEYESRKAEVSHGICPECLRGLLGGTEISLREFLDTLEFPVLIADKSAMVQQANRTAGRMFGRDASKLENTTVGMAIECFNALVPGGCGTAERCAGCVLRQTLTDTYADGQPRYAMYSKNEILTPQGTKPKRFRFSTTRIGDTVMLAIEEAQDLSAAS